MKAFSASRVLVLLLVLMALFTAFAVMAANLYAVGGQTRDLGAVIALFAMEHDHIPASIDELVEAGYARPSKQAGLYDLFAGPTGEPLDRDVPVDLYDVSWGVQPEQLIERDGGVFWRDTPDRRVLLVRHTSPPWVVRVLRGRMAMTFPVELYRRLGGQVAASQPAGGNE